MVRGVDLEDRPFPRHIAVVPKEATTPGRWVDAGDLRVGDELILLDGRIEKVQEVRLYPMFEQVYNFSVDDLECYAVGRCGVLVHNTNGTMKVDAAPTPAQGVGDPRFATHSVDATPRNVAPSRVSPNLKVEPVELLGGGKGRDFALYAEDGAERFSARLLDGEKTLSIGWTDNIPRTGLRLREVQQLAGGPGSFTRITGMASDQLEVAIRAGTFDTNKVAEMLGRTLGGKWGVKVTPRPGQAGVFDIVAELIGN